jgi:hypothetical protein
MALEATSDRVKYAYGLETAFGETFGGAYRRMRATGDTLKTSVESISSGELRGDAQVADNRRTGVSGGGTIMHEMSVDPGIEEMIEAALRSAAFATPAAAIAGTIAVTGAGTITDSGNGFVSPAGIAVGDMILMHGWTTPGNNNVFKVATVAAGTITTVEQSLTAEIAGAGKTLQPGTSRANTAVTMAASFTIEKQKADLANDYSGWRGCSVNGFKLSVTSKGMVMIDFDFLIKDEIGVRDGESRPTVSLGSSYIAQGTAAPFASPSDVTSVLGGSAEYDPVSFDLTFSRNLRPREVATVLGHKSHGQGTQTVTGAITLLYEDSTHMDMYLAHTDTGVVYKFVNGALAYAFEVPLINYTDGDDSSSGKDADIEARLSWSAKKEVSGGENMIRVWVFA